jgi:hypothetical protein
MRHLSASVIFLLTAACTLAQTSNPPPSSAGKSEKPTTFYLERADNFGCPVGFSASRQADVQTMLANSRGEAGPAQGLHLSLSHPAAPAIQSVEVTVYATSQKLRALPLDAAGRDTISKTFELKRQADSDSLSGADVWMHQVGSVRWADLISITYANGSTWHANESVKCRAVPSNFVLVTRR